MARITKKQLNKPKSPTYLSPTVKRRNQIHTLSSLSVYHLTFFLKPVLPFSYEDTSHGYNLNPSTSRLILQEAFPLDQQGWK